MRCTVKPVLSLLSTILLINKIFNDGGRVSPLVPQHGLSPGFVEERTTRYEGQLQIYSISSLKALK